jgi:hypothetical protein
MNCRNPTAIHTVHRNSNANIGQDRALVMSAFYNLSLNADMFNNHADQGILSSGSASIWIYLRTRALVNRFSEIIAQQLMNQ